MDARVSSIAAAAALTLIASSAGAERICKYTDEDGVVTYTNLCGGAKRFHGGKGKSRTADPELAKLQSGASAPVEFVPNDQTAKYDATIKEACAANKVPPALVRAIMNAESNFDPRAMSDKGAIGLMQLMPDTGDEMAVRDIRDPQENIRGGVRYLRALTNRFDGDMLRVIAAYNAGPNAVIAAGGVPQIPETQDYVRKVMRLYYHYKGEPVPASLASIIGR